VGQRHPEHERGQRHPGPELDPVAVSAAHHAEQERHEEGRRRPEREAQQRTTAALGSNVAWNTLSAKTTNASNSNSTSRDARAISTPMASTTP
jgi:hypothetical protein